MKRLSLISFFLLSCIMSFANHITGGEMYYVLLNQQGNNFTYRITLKLYRDCNAPAGSAQLDPEASIAIYNNSTFASVFAGKVTRSNIVVLDLTSPSQCIQNPPTVCYQVGYYDFTVTLPGTPQGYTVTYQRCCRIAGINNLLGSSSAGATYTAMIPGNSVLADAPKNSSARFSGKDTVIVCANNSFCYDFSAFDADDDSLSYSFSNAYVGGNTAAPIPDPPAAPPYTSVAYAPGFSPMAPLGIKVNLNPKTGQMCGVAPAAGIYVVTVAVTEWRNGVPIAVQRKDLQIKVGDCNLAAAQPIVIDEKGIVVNPDYSSCNGYNYTFQNRIPNNPLIHTYNWEFGDGGTGNTSQPTHTYTDTGLYVVKLVINRGEECSDSTTTKLRIYPGFFAGFTTNGICFNKPTFFADTTKTKFGTVDSWRWDFGKPNIIDDTSQLKNPSYTYNQAGAFDVRFIVTSTKGCVDTVRKTLNILDKPILSLGFRDTLICRSDSVQLKASGGGQFSWSPNSNISNAAVADPVVSPAATTRYYVTLDDNGCVNTDSVRVRVINFVTLDALPDTTICTTDPIQLRANSDGLKFQWSPSAGMNNSTAINPVVTPISTTTYTVIAIVGSCSATDSVKVSLVPYPKANAGPDQVICFNNTAQLNASTDGNRVLWSPSSSLSNAAILNPVASPAGSTTYILSAFDNKGCPKPGKDTVTINVLPEIIAYAGGDTAVVVNQPLQFNATGGSGYLWTPSTGLSRNDINNPVGLYDGSFDSIRYTITVFNESGCADSTYLTVKIFKSSPQIYVPTAFTPNGDGRNDIIKPIPVGISRMDYFRIYNRWGQLVYNTTSLGTGWDGKIAGKEQGTGTYVWLVRGVDFLGKVFVAKGMVTLIR
jgi:gliding motility-associated-like protein